MDYINRVIAMSQNAILQPFYSNEILWSGLDCSGNPAGSTGGRAKRFIGSWWDFLADGDFDSLNTREPA